MKYVIVAKKELELMDDIAAREYVNEAITEGSLVVEVLSYNPWTVKLQRLDKDKAPVGVKL